MGGCLQYHKGRKVMGGCLVSWRQEFYGGVYIIMKQNDGWVSTMKKDDGWVSILSWRKKDDGWVSILSWRKVMSGCPHYHGGTCWLGVKHQLTYHGGRKMMDGCLHCHEERWWLGVYAVGKVMGGVYITTEEGRWRQCVLCFHEGKEGKWRLELCWLSSLVPGDRYSSQTGLTRLHSIVVNMLSSWFWWTTLATSSSVVQTPIEKWGEH